MKAKSSAMLRVLLNHYHKDSIESLLNYLPADDKRNVLDQEVFSEDIFQAAARPEDRLQFVHYSWFVEPIQRMTPSLQKYVISALPESQALGLSRLLNQSYQPLALSEPIKGFFLNILSNYLHAEEISPPSYLPKGPLISLALLDKKQLTELIDLLAMHDLVHEVRHIVDKKRLKLLYACLTKKQQLYLRTVLHQHDKIPVTKLGLDRWDGDCKNLEAIIHLRGLVRFAKALAGQDSQLIWHVTHILDTGRSAVLTKNLAAEKVSMLNFATILQVVNAFNFLKQPPKEIS